MTALLPGRIRVHSRWTGGDRWNAVRCRLGRFRMGYAVAPGLYILDAAGPGSPVIVSGNYRLTFDMVRRDLAGVPCWILILDTGGIDVWSASAAGTFSTDAVVAAVKRSRLSEVVRHRDLIIPRLGAAGIDAAVVLQHCGFAVRVGPVRSKDLPMYLGSGETSPSMSEVRFSITDRLALTPWEVGRSLKAWAVFVLGAFLYSGATPSGVLVDRAWPGTWTLAALGLGAVFAGSFLAPAILPWVPLRSVALKGWAVGAAVCAAILFGAGLASGMDPLQAAASLVFFPAASAFMTRAFGAALPLHDPAAAQAARREKRLFVPLFAAACVVSAGLFVLSKLRQWGLL
ncbi:MAG TPA: mercury methylation corrinoid protein HgcA [Spirochaetia bacterium]|nr:mercury methylation corrinoid protein HgcA [Spirochaetia bacterium]